MPDPGEVLRAPALARAAEWAVMLTEVALPFALASRRARVRAGAFAVGVAMHTVMHAWLFPQLFTFLMLARYFAVRPWDQRGTGRDDSAVEITAGLVLRQTVTGGLVRAR